jgi:glyoxylase-like metal-dependent hydrolase (beta-lactamase superfamily II)
MNNQPFRFHVGAFECMLVFDGALAYHAPQPQFMFANAPDAEAQQSLQAYTSAPAHAEHNGSAYFGLLINTGRQLVLVDTGAGHLVPDTGQLIANLRAAGIAPEQIDTVILTHAHLDHIGGIVDQSGKPAFPKARYVMTKRDYQFWTQAPDLSRMPFPSALIELFRTFVAQKLVPLQPDLIEDEVEIAAGIETLAAPGPTPGHIALNITSAGEQLLYLVDTVLHPIHIEHPEWYAAVDQDPAQTVATRKRLFERAAHDQARVLVFHFPFPGLGHLTQHGAGWHWQTMD